MWKESKKKEFDDLMNHSPSPYMKDKIWQWFEKEVDSLPKEQKDRLDRAEQLLKEALRCYNNDKESRGVCCQCREAINNYFTPPTEENKMIVQEHCPFCGEIFDAIVKYNFHLLDFHKIVLFREVDELFAKEL